jgi:hypothetical protein
MTPRSCAEVEARLTAGGDAAAITVAAASHLAACPACRTLLADLAAIRRAAGGLPPLAPPPAVWARLAVTLADEPSRGDRRLALPASWLAAAAALLLAVGAALGTLTGGQRPAGDAGSDPVTQVTADLAAAEAHYLRAIAGLEGIARRGDSTLDPDVAAVLRANLEALDGAIRETRAALAAQPDDELARRGYFEALDGKVALLEQTVSLIDAERAFDAAVPPLQHR